MLQLRESDATMPGLLACLPETRIGLFDLSASTRTEPLSYVSGSSHRASVESCREVTTDLDLYTQGDPLANPFALRQGSYSYVAGNPLGLVDPLGLSPCGPCCQTDGQRQEDKRRIMTAINIALYSYNATHFYVPQTQCETYSAIVSRAIGKAKPTCFDWNDVFSQEKSWLGIFSQYYNEPAHTATALRPCNASGWPDGTILDAWPEGILKEFSWDQWKPKLGGGRYSPIVYDPMGGGRGTCPFKP